MPISEDTLIYDIETKTYGPPDPDKDNLRIFGCYSYKTKKYYLLTKKEDVQRIINAHKIIVGFNNQGTRYQKGYDNPILIREGIDLKYKIIIDLMVIFKQRASQMKIKKGMLGDILMRFSLDYITKTLDLVDKEERKMEIDYSIFQKDVWTKEEMDLVSKYTKRDIEITKKLYEWVEDYFSGFTEFLSPEDINKKYHLTKSLAGLAYKAICKACNWEEQYNENGDVDDNRISGGYVAYPAGEKFEGNIYCIDFNSLYPHIMIQCNLFGRKHTNDMMERPVWYGGDKWEVEGTYYSDEISPVGKLLRQWYFNRLYFKRNFLLVEDKKIYKMKDIEKFKGKEIYRMEKGSSQLTKKEVDDDIIKQFLRLADKGVDRREYTIKIFINIMYGILNNPYYALVYDRVAGGDCTRIGRQWTKYARKKFKEAGYPVIYTDTDSVYIIDKQNNKEEMLKVRDKIIKDIKDTVPFSQDTFDLGIDDEIKYMYFFKGKNTDEKETDVEMDEDDFLNKPKGFMKKNYIYVTQEGKVKIKNLGIKKKSISELAKQIFWFHLVPQIKQGQIKFSKSFINNILKEAVAKDVSVASLRKEVGPFSQYAQKSPTSLPAQIAKRYGAGIHFLIPNLKKIGVGKGKSFCTIEEFNANKMTIHDIDYSNVWMELDYFVKPVVTKNIFDYE